MGIKTLLSAKWGPIVAWQVCSLDLCLIGSICSFIVKLYGSTIPLLMLSLAYLFLFIFNIWWYPKSDTPWWKYIIVAVAGLMGDYSAVEAYNTTSLASAMLIVTTVVFWVAPLSFFILGRKISKVQIMSIFLGAFGVFLVFLAEKSGGSRWQGNIWALISAISYAISTVLQEALVSSDSVRLLLIRFSVCALPLSSLSSLFIEKERISRFKWETRSILLFTGYSIFLSFYYIMVPVILQYSNATVMNLSCLTSNFYSLGVSIVFFEFKASYMYVIGFLCIPIAITLFSLYPPSDEKLIMNESLENTQEIS